MSTTKPTFTSGPIMGHILTMASTSAAGLLTIFIVDFVDMYFLSLLGEAELAAAVGYAGTILFFTTSINIGLSIACGALTSQSIGKGNEIRAKRFMMSCLMLGSIFTSIIALIFVVTTPQMLGLIGASGRTLELAQQYLIIILPTMPIMMIGMCTSATLRSLGAAKLAMYSTLVAGLVNAIFDPIFIFGFDMGISGAAWASVLARIAMASVGLFGVIKIHQMWQRISWKQASSRLPALTKIAIPAILTNISTPIGNAYVTASMAQFGDQAVAGFAVVGRLIPVAFAALFALSGAVGPIAGQNFGAQNFQRVHATLSESLKFCLYYVAIISVVLFLSRNVLIDWFNLGPEAGGIVIFFCTFISFTFIFNGIQFVSNALFNNLGFPQYSTYSNIGKATLGTIPVVSLGAYLWGAQGVLIGQAVGSIIFGIISYRFCRAIIHKLERGELTPGKGNQAFRRFPLWPFSSQRN